MGLREQILANKDDTKKKTQCRCSAIFIVYILEILATCDFVTDVLVLLQLSRTSHAGFFAMTLLGMIAPLFIAYLPFLDYLTEKVILAVYKDTDRVCKLKTIGYISATPFIVIYMQFLDIMFLLFTIILAVIKLLNYVLCIWYFCGDAVPDAAERFFEYFYEAIYDM